MENSYKDSKPTEHIDINPVPWRVYEKTIILNEARDKRKDIIIGVLIVLLALTNALWLYYWNSYEWVDDYSVDVDAGDGVNANYIGNDGDIYNGESNSTQDKNEKTEERTEQGNKS